MVKTSLDWAEAIPSNTNKGHPEKDKVLKRLNINGYTTNFIESVCKRRKILKQECRGYTSIPYMKEVSERVKRILTSGNVMTAYKPKHRPSGARVKSRSCPFTYIGQSGRSYIWDKNKDQIGCDMHTDDVQILEKGVSNYKHWVFPFVHRQRISKWAWGIHTCIYLLVNDVYAHAVTNRGVNLCI